MPNEEKVEASKVDTRFKPFSLADVIPKWEAQLDKLTPQQADHEFARILGQLRIIGERVGRRLAAALAGHCSGCGGPLPPRGPFDTVPKPAPHMPSGWLNQFACSSTCAEKLRVEVHNREMERLAAQ